VESTITVLNIGRMNDDVQQEAQRVDQDVPLATLDLLARVVAPKDRAKPPWILEPSATGLCEPDLHVFAKLFEGRQERGLETQAFANSSAWQHSLRS
jgi:hypothetical protein